MHHRGFSQVILLGIIAVIIMLAGVGGFLVLREKKEPLGQQPVLQPQNSKRAEDKKQGPKTETSNVAASLPGCNGNNYYSVSPIPLNQLDYILPLGNINPGGHSTPSDHLYFVITRTVPGSHVPDTVDVFAPGDMTIYSVGRQRQIANGKVVNEDYFISFALCKELTGSFGHVSDLAGPLSNNMDFTECNSYSGGTTNVYEQCRADVHIQVKAGEKIGTAGGKLSAALDFWTIDERLPNPRVANPNRQYNLKATCAINYYPEDLRAKLSLFLGGGNRQRTIEPVCGEIFQDKPGTLQGNWYSGAADRNTPADWNTLMAMVHDPIDPRHGIVSIGGVISEPGTFYYQPRHSGFLNREPSEVTADGNIYCYEPEAILGYASLPGHLLTQLIDGAHLKIEHRDGACDSSYKFFSPTTYER